MCSARGMASFIKNVRDQIYSSFPANWNPPAPAGGGMRNSREVAFLKGATGSCRWGLHCKKAKGRLSQSTQRTQSEKQTFGLGYDPEHVLAFLCALCASL